jgi:hypothetical protein
MATRYLITARCQGFVDEQCERCVADACKRYGVQVAAPGEPSSPDFSIHVMEDGGGNTVVTWFWIVIAGHQAGLAAELRDCGTKIDVTLAGNSDGWDARMLEALVADGWIRCDGSAASH